MYSSKRGMGSVILVLSLGSSIFAEAPRIDTVAVAILDKMAESIGKLNSCSFTLNVSNDMNDVYLGSVKYHYTHKVIMAGPDRMQVDTQGDSGHRGWWYNGKQLSFYSYTRNNYAVMDAPATTIATIDSVNKMFGIDFPAADFFYPTFTDDLIQQCTDIILVGKSRVGDTECSHIIAKNSQLTAQFWIADDQTSLPRKFVIVYYDETPPTQYEGDFSDWKLNPRVDEKSFEFTVPKGANKLTLIPRK